MSQGPRFCLQKVPPFYSRFTHILALNDLNLKHDHNTMHFSPISPSRKVSSRLLVPRRCITSQLQMNINRNMSHIFDAPSAEHERLPSLCGSTRRRYTPFQLVSEAREEISSQECQRPSRKSSGSVDHCGYLFGSASTDLHSLSLPPLLDLMPQKARHFNRPRTSLKFGP